MKGKKNLERAIVLGLILSTGLYSTAWAKLSNQLWINTDAKTGSEFKLDYPNRDWEINNRKEVDQKHFEAGVLVTSTNPNSGINYNFTFTWNLNSLNINITKLAEGIENTSDNYYIAGIMTDGFDKDKTANLILTTNNDINVNVNSQNNYSAVGVWAQSSDSIKLTSNTGDVTITVNKTEGDNLSYINGGYPNITQTEDRKLHAVYGLNASSNPQNSSEQGGAIEVITNNGSISVTAKNKSEDLTNSHVYAAANDNGHLILSAGQGTGYDGTGSISLSAESIGNNNVYGLDTWGGEENRLTADEIYLSAKAESGTAYALKASGGAKDNNFTADYNKFTAEAGANGTFSAGESYAMWVDGNSVVTVNGKQNDIIGAVYANGSKSGEASTIIIGGKNGETAINNFVSASAIKDAGGIYTKDTLPDGETDSEKEIKQVVSALYAEGGAKIEVSGINNIQTSYKKPSDDTTSERAVWAYNKANIDIDGYTYISTYDYENSPNSMDIAIAAGTATNLDKGDFTNDKLTEAGLANVKLDYENYNGYKSQVRGDILSAYAGKVDIDSKDETSGIDITGNLLAGNNGVLNVDLGNGGILTGRADDYGDAGVISNSGHGTTANQHNKTFFDPAFSSDIIKGGQVNLTMGENSRWNVTGQSWITSIDTEKSSNAVIDLISANTDRNKTAHALTVYEFNGDAIFNMNLDANRAVSDMLYMREANGDYIINVVDPVTVADMYAGGLDGLRFATVGSGIATFKAVTLEQGAFNLEYAVDTDNYANNEENIHYNGDEMNHYKPGDSMVDGFFDKKNNAKPGDPIKESGESAATNSANIDYGVMLLDENNETENAEVTANGEEEKFEGVKNIKLTGISNTELSSAGQAILNMSRANYSNAIYMDRLNKRLGEARYINGEEDEGMWVRIRHDRIGKTDAYRSQNTMYELGYDKKQECDNGERRVGFAVDYMHGDTGYSDIAGKGEIDRYGLWLYDTWTGDKGHYVDYVAKWGHLDNDFEIYAPITGEKIDGDYSNNVFSVSAEYGKKNDMGNGWYIEPQVQAQLARVTGADYVTSQDTKVSVDGINSLIGRAGFRLGKDFGEDKQSTIYIKADVLHEFLGDQDISVMDDTTNDGWAGISYENEGTWYDIGFGFATMMSKNSYAFLDLEKSFGHDNDETYQINVGMQWSF